MATFTLRIETDNAAFEDDPGELARILRKLAQRVDKVAQVEGDWGKVMDANGNTVGEWRIA